MTGGETVWLRVFLQSKYLAHGGDCPTFRAGQVSLGEQICMENFELVDLHVRQDNTGVFFQPVSQEGGQGCQYDFVAPENSIRAEDRKVQDILTQILKVNFNYFKQKRDHNYIFSLT